MPIRSVRVRVLPWRPRWRAGRHRDVDVSLVGAADDPVSFVVLLLAGIVLGPLLALLVLGGVGLVVLSVELVVLVALMPLAWAGQVLGLLPWTVVVTYEDGTREYRRVRGTRALLAERRSLDDRGRCADARRE